jgi:hypothetical protein
MILYGLKVGQKFLETINIIFSIGVNWGGGGKCHLQYFFQLEIVFLVTDLNNGKYEIYRKKKMKNFRFMGPIFPSFKFEYFVK